MINQIIQKSYDEVPYPSYAYPQTHPDHLATLATLSGMTPPAVARCRVLELGCASGGTLIPMAYSLPESEFVGLDLSSRAVATGQQLITELNLKNVTLNQNDILHTPHELGQFDYIIAYGIYSWVPTPVREKMLTICRETLSPNGVAYISYNTYPGWHMYNIIREAMLYHTRQTTDPQARIEKARAMLTFMAESCSIDDSFYEQFLNKMKTLLDPMADGYLGHDFMEEINYPLYFSQFIAQAEQHGLQYLANAEFASPNPRSADVTKKIFELTEEIIEVEQYLDFMTNRTFRETVLCHQEIVLNRTLRPDCLTSLHIASQVQPTSPDLPVNSTEVVEFHGSQKTSLSTAHPLTKAALSHLAQVWPQAISFDALVTEARAILEATEAGAKQETEAKSEDIPSSDDVQTLVINLLTAYNHSMNLVSFHTHQPRFVLEISERPVASATARYQAQNNLPITNLYHQRVDMGQFPRQLLVYLDGQRDYKALLDIMIQSAEQGLLEVTQDEQPVEDAVSVRNILAEELDRQLYQMGQTALLVG